MDASESPFGARGTALYGALAPEGTDLATVVLAQEAARAADRLDELDRIIAGKGVLQLMRFRVPEVFDDGDGEKNVRVEVKFDQVLAEARQQQNGLRQMLTTLGVGKPAGAESPKPASAEEATEDELAARRARAAGAEGAVAAGGRGRPRTR